MPKVNFVIVDQPPKTFLTTLLLLPYSFQLTNLAYQTHCAIATLQTLENDYRLQV